MYNTKQNITSTMSLFYPLIQLFELNIDFVTMKDVLKTIIRRERDGTDH